MKVEVSSIQRHFTMSTTDCICHHCNHPYEAGPDVELHHCPKCGCPANKNDVVSRAKASGVRKANGLIP